MYIIAMRSKIHRILAVFSDVDFSPQLIAILQKLLDQGGEVRVILIGHANLQIATEIESRGWNSKNIRQRGKVASIVNLLMVSLEIIRYRPETLLASGQFATAIGTLSAKFLNVPNRVFIRHHSNFHHKYRMKFGIIIDHVSNRLATTIVAVSNVVKDVLTKSEYVNSNKIKVIYNGVDLNKFRFNAHVSIAGPPKNIGNSSLFKIGVISRLTEWKGVEYTARAFVKLQEEFPNARLHIVGAFSDSYTEVKNILSQVPAGTYTLDKINTNIPKFLHGLGAFVHVPVGIDDEAFGIVYIEALASGIPCIFTRSGVLNELDAPNSYANIVSSRNSEEIYLNLKEIIQGENVLKARVPESWLNQFSLEVMANHYADLLLGED